MSMAALEGWINRMQSISAIVEQGCRFNGIPGAGELLLDMLGDLIHDINSIESSPIHEVGMSQAEGEVRETAEEYNRCDRTQ